MAHMRAQIRQAVAAAIAGLPTSGARVFVNRVYELRAADLPCLMVQTGAEPQIEPFTVDGRALQRQLLLSVRAIAKATAALDDTLDQMLLEVEGAMALTTLGGLVKRVELKSVDSGLSDALDTPCGELTATWLVTYFTPTATPDTHL